VEEAPPLREAHLTLCRDFNAGPSLARGPTTVSSAANIYLKHLFEARPIMGFRD
jgi:hypothetical protein